MKQIVAALLLLGFALPHVVHASHAGLSAAQQLAFIERTTQSIRQLRQRAPVRADFPNDSTFNADLRASLKRDDPDSEILTSQKEMVTLGLLPASANLKHLIFHDLGKQVVGFYDPRRKVLYVRNDHNALYGPLRSTIAHEYTHALQDQYYGLLRLTPDLTHVRYRNSDALTAHHALTEGDAVLTQSLFIDKTYSPQDLSALIKLSRQAAAGPSLPPALQRQFDFPYTTGVAFVRSLFNAGGMHAVAAAYTRLPSSSYEIMHPAAYAAHWKATAVRLHAVQGFSDWQQLDDDVLGAVNYQIFLQQWLAKPAAVRAVQQYRGDRYVFLEKAGQDAMLLKSVWASHPGALAVKAAWMKTLQARFPQARSSSSSGPAVVQAAAYAVYLRVNGKGLTVAYAPTAALATQLATAPES